MKHYYADVPNLGNVAISRHAQDKMKDENISQLLFEEVLFQPSRTVADGIGILKLEGRGISIVVLEKPTPFRGAKLVKTVYRTLAPNRI